MHQDGEALHRTAVSARREAEEIRGLLEGSVKDAKALKSPTFIALIYLPANLVAVSRNFSSTPQFAISTCKIHARLRTWLIATDI
jgi:hypothetical protein